MLRNRRRSLRTRLTGALLLAAVAVAMLALASPAVARSAVHTVIYPHALSSAALIAVLGLAAAAAVALVTGVVLASRARSERKLAPADLQGREKRAPWQQAA